MSIDQKVQEDKNEIISIISDVYKEVNGFRPRCYNFQDWTLNELDEFFKDLVKQSEELRKEEEEFGKVRLQEFKNTLNNLKSNHNLTENEALRWMLDGFIDGSGGFDYLTIEGFTMYHDISYTNYGKEIEKKLLKIVNRNLKKYIV